MVVKAASDADSRGDNDGASHEDTHVGPPSLESQGTTIERTPDKLVAQVQHLDFEILQMPGVALRFGVLLGEPTNALKTQKRGQINAPRWQADAVRRRQFDGCARSMKQESPIRPRTKPPAARAS